jgi:hypothetical protein
LNYIEGITKLTRQWDFLEPTKRIGKPLNKPALLVTTYEGYGDLIYHTPTIRILSKHYTHLDVWCRQPDPFINNPYIKSLTVFDKTLPGSHDVYGPHVYCVMPESVIQFLHCSIHTVDLVSIKALHRVLRDAEKTLEAYWTPEDMCYVRQLLLQHPLSAKNKVMEGQFVVISPSKTWPSRTLPLPFYQKLIANIQAQGYGVVLVGKDIVYASGIDQSKTLYDAHHFPGTICLYNQLTFAQLCALYSITPIAINTENGHNPTSCTNDYCWNIYIPTLTAPENRLPHRHGSQQYRTVIATNPDDYYPASVYGVSHYAKNGVDSYATMPISIPTVEHVLCVFQSVLARISEGKNYI